MDGGGRAARGLGGRAASARRAEALAAALLSDKGIRIVARNWRRPEGEIDIVADDQGTCVFVEVRSRTGVDRGHALETVNARKRARVVRAARLYLDAEPTRASGYRFDVVGVTFDPEGGPADVVHVPAAFERND